MGRRKLSKKQPKKKINKWSFFGAANSWIKMSRCSGSANWQLNPLHVSWWLHFVWLPAGYSNLTQLDWFHHAVCFNVPPPPLPESNIDAQWSVATLRKAQHHFWGGPGLLHSPFTDSVILCSLGDSSALYYLIPADWSGRSRCVWNLVRQEFIPDWFQLFRDCS